MFVYASALDPCTHRIAFESEADAVLARLESELSGEGDPPIRMRRESVFESDTGEFMLRTRVAQGLMNTCDHDSWTRLARALD
jgi:hypothetical protein